MVIASDQPGATPRLRPRPTWRPLTLVVVGALVLSVAGTLPPNPAPPAVATGATSATAATSATGATPGRSAQAGNWGRAIPPLPESSALADQLYRRVVGAEPSTSDLKSFGFLLDGGVAPTAVTGRMTRTLAFARDRVAGIYDTVLGRQPEAAGLAYWAGRVADGDTLETLTLNLVASAEFSARARATYPDDPTAIAQTRALYEPLLGRPADDGGVSFWADKVSDGVPLWAVGAFLIRSQEKTREVARRVFATALDRAPDPGGLAYWAERYRGDLDRAGLLARLAGSAEATRSGCDPFRLGSACLLPFPDNSFTVADSSTATGRRVALKPSFTPTNVDGRPVSPVELNRNDGFSPGSPMLVPDPGVDFAASGAPSVDDIGRSLDADSPVVVIDTDTGERWPVWMEPDAQATGDETPLMFIRPGRNFADGHTYVVALRNLTGTDGEPVEAPATFAAHRDGDDLDIGGFASRTPRMEEIFDTLSSAGVARDDLYLAWDFTVASTRNLAQRLVSMRDDAFARLGDGVPPFSVTSVEPDDRPGTARVVRGTFETPSYLSGDGGPGATFNTGPDGLPTHNGSSITEPFVCTVPEAGLDEPQSSSLYGHGLFGTADQVAGGDLKAFGSEQGYVMCATPWIGMSSEDLGVTADILAGNRDFTTLVDRLQQAHLNFLFLGRLLTSSAGLVTDPAFQNEAGEPVIAPDDLAYIGGSQGGILGGSLTAVGQEFTRSALVVPAMNYSTLLDRSVDWPPFNAIYESGYPSPVDQQIGLSLIQTMWDRGEANGYANHITTDPLPNTPEHRVLMAAAFGDHQVSNIAADVEARTIGAKAHCPALADGRSPNDLTLWNVDCIDAYPYEGSAIFYFDSGTDPPPLPNVAPTEGDTVATHDPHGDPSGSPMVRELGGHFLDTGEVLDVCDGEPCVIPPG